MIWFILCLLGVLSVLNFVPLSLHYVILASGIVLLYTAMKDAPYHRAN